MLTWIHFGNHNRAKMEGPIGSEGPNSCSLSALWGLMIKNHLKINKKINEHRPKIYQKSTKKPPKIKPRRPQETLLLALGRQEAPTRPQDAPRHSQEGLLEASWGPGGCLGRKKVPKMAPSWRPKRKQNPSWGVLEASWEPLGGVM